MSNPIGCFKDNLDSVNIARGKKKSYKAINIIFSFTPWKSNSSMCKQTCNGHGCG